MKGLATLAELFTVLAILFLVQTVLNFAASTESTKVETPRHIVLTISQIPSNNEYVDHIRYIQMGDELLILKPEGCAGNSMSPISVGSVLRDGQCTSPPETSVTALDPGYPDYQKIFSERVAERYGVRIAFSSGYLPDPENEEKATREQLLPMQITFAYAVRDLPKDAGDIRLSIGYCLCLLEITPASLQVLPVWGLDAAAIPYPHPLVVRITTLEANVTTVRDLVFNHAEMDRGGGKDIIRNGSGRVELATLFRSADCQLSAPAERAETLRQYTISLRNL